MKNFFSSDILFFLLGMLFIAGIQPSLVQAQNERVIIPVVYPAETSVIRVGDRVTVRWTPPIGLSGRDAIVGVDVYIGELIQYGSGAELSKVKVANNVPVSAGQYSWNVSRPSIANNVGGPPISQDDFLRKFKFTLVFKQGSIYYNELTKELIPTPSESQAIQILPASTDTRPYVSMRASMRIVGNYTPQGEAEFIPATNYPFSLAAGALQVPLMTFKVISINAASVLNSLRVNDWSLDPSVTIKSTAFASRLYLYDGNTLIGTADNLSKVYRFNALSIAMNKDQEKVFTIKGDFPGTIANNSKARIEVKELMYKTVTSGSPDYSAPTHLITHARTWDSTWLANPFHTFVIGVATPTPYPNSPSVRVVLPNGGETFAIGSSQRFNFTSANLPAGAMAGASLDGGPTNGLLASSGGTMTFVSAGTGHIDLAIREVVTAATGLSTPILPGTYRVRILIYERVVSSNCSGSACGPQGLITSDLSDGTIAITSSVPPLGLPRVPDGLRVQ